MIYIVAKAVHTFNKYQDESEYMADEAVQVFNSKDEAESACEIFTQVNSGYTYVVITKDQIGEWV